MTAPLAASKAVKPVWSSRWYSAWSQAINLYCPVLHGVYRCDVDGLPTFVEVAPPTDDEMNAPLQRVITRLMKMLTRKGVQIEEMGQTYLAEPDDDGEEARTLRSLRSLQAAAIPYRIAFGSRKAVIKIVVTGLLAANMQLAERDTAVPKAKTKA